VQKVIEISQQLTEWRSNIHCNCVVIFLLVMCTHT